MNRRKFLAKAALGTSAVAVPAFIPAPVLGRAGFTPPSDRITIGCIGLGGQGIHNMRALASQPDTEILALCDVQGYAGENPFGAAGLRVAQEKLRELPNYADRKKRSEFRDFRELLERKDIDAVTVCTPDHWHGLITIAAANSGKDIYCEKPLTNTIAEGRAVCDAVHANARILQTGSHERSNDTVRFTCELIRNGHIGELREIVVNMPNNDPHHERLKADRSEKLPMPVPESLDWDLWLGPTQWRPYIEKGCHVWWRFIFETGGGEMTDRGAHILDLAQFINKADDSGPVRIEAKGKQLDNTLYDAFIEYQFECHYKNGVKLIGTSEGERGLKLVGSEGWIFIHIHGGRLEADPVSLLTETVGPKDIHIERSPGHHRNFLDAVKTRRNPMAPAEVGHRTGSLCHLLNIAMLTGKSLDWDPVQETITNYPEVNQYLKRPMRAPWHL